MSINDMTCRNCGTTENVGEDGLCGDCQEEEDWEDELDESLGEDDDREGD